MLHPLRSLAAAAFALLILAAPADAQKNCTKGKPCGNTCIAANKTCRVGTGTAVQATTPANSNAVVVPEGALYVASTRGVTYYAVTCRGWRSLAPSNLRWFKSLDEATAAGLRPSAQAGCGVAVTPAAAAAASSVLGPAPAPGSSATCTISVVVDGDTVHCREGQKVRLLLVDAPEMDQGVYGPLAKSQLAELLPTGMVTRLEYDVEVRDRYDRDLAYVFLLDGSMANEELLRSGMAVVSVYPPNVKHVERFRTVADEAQASKRGLWATSAFGCLPADHRAGRCTPSPRHPMEP